MQNNGHAECNSGSPENSKLIFTTDCPDQLIVPTGPVRPLLAGRSVYIVLVANPPAGRIMGVVHIYQYYCRRESLLKFALFRSDQLTSINEEPFSAAAVGSCSSSCTCIRRFSVNVLAWYEKRFN